MEGGFVHGTRGSQVVVGKTWSACTQAHSALREGVQLTGCDDATPHSLSPFHALTHPSSHCASQATFHARSWVKSHTLPPSEFFIKIYESASPRRAITLVSGSAVVCGMKLLWHPSRTEVFG